MLNTLTKEELEAYLGPLDRRLQDLAGHLPVWDPDHDDAVAGWPDQTQRNLHLAIRALRLEIACTAQDAWLTLNSVSPGQERPDGRPQLSELQSIFVQLSTRELGNDIDPETIGHLDRLVALGAALLWLLFEDSPVPGALLRPVRGSLIDGGRKPVPGNSRADAEALRHVPACDGRIR